MAPLCKYYQLGNCRNGANCRFEHPGANTNPFGASSSNTNRFGALSNSGGGGEPSAGTNQYKITKDSIKLDLADERPPWILSCYGPGRDAPEQLFGGYPREQSLEEVRLYVMGSANPQQALSEVQALYQQAEQQIQASLNNLDGAVQFVLTAENKHPNRVDICNQNSREGGTNGVFARNATQQGGFASNPFATTPSANQNPFQSASQANPFGGGGGSTGAPAFGQPSALGRKPNPFASSAAPAFGQPSQLGASAPAFGKPSQLGAAAPAFGQPSKIGSSGPAFGQPSALGQKPNPFAAASAPSGFAQIAAHSTPSPFGQPATLGQQPNPFGAPAAPASSPFGKPAVSNPFAQQISAPADQSMDTTSTPAQRNPFGQPSSGPSGFAAAAKNPFGQPSPSPFGAPATPAAPAAPAARGNPFAQAQAQAQSQTQSQAAKPASGQNNPYAPDSKKQHPPVESYTARGLDGRLTAWMGQPVVYRWKAGDRYQDRRPEDAAAGEQPVPGVRNPDGSWRKILFPNGPPAYNRDTEPAEPADYTDAVRAAYEKMGATGRFEGDMPEVPPLREDCAWAF